MRFPFFGESAQQNLVGTAVVTGYGFLNSIPEGVKLFFIMLAVAGGNLLVSWLRFKKAEYDEKREKLEAESTTQESPSRDDSRAGFASLDIMHGIVLVCCALAFAFLACCARPPAGFVVGFANDELGKCVAAGAEHPAGDYVLRAGALTCVANRPEVDTPDIPVDPSGSRDGGRLGVQVENPEDSGPSLPVTPP